jgi:hypothetical protein
MVIELESIGPHLDRIAEDWSNGVDYGAEWPSKIFAAKYHAVEASWRVVDLGLDVAGGHGIFRSAGYERLLRDARLGRIHPANSLFLRTKWSARPRSVSASMSSPGGASVPKVRGGCTNALCRPSARRIHAHALSKLKRLMILSGLRAWRTPMMAR